MFVPSPLSLYLPLNLPIEFDVNYADVFPYDPAKEEPEGANMLRMISYVQEDLRTYVRCLRNAELKKTFLHEDRERSMGVAVI